MTDRMLVFRSQTTKGIWLARCAGIEPCTLVMDLEGTDGRERGEVPLHAHIHSFLQFHSILCHLFDVYLVFIIFVPFQCRPSMIYSHAHVIHSFP